MSLQTTSSQVDLAIQRGRTLVSKTDLEGKITYVNQALSEVTGYAEDEVLGQTHSIMRHPDVPDAVFAHLWRTLQNGRPWRGVLKNLCKNGDYYWADAYIVPLKKSGKTIGYMSARSEPSVEQIAEAEADYAFAAKHGTVRAEQGLRPLRYFSVKRGVLTGIFFVLVATAVSAWFGVRGLEKTSMLVYGLQRHSDLSAMVTKGNQQVAISLSNILLALQHVPGKRQAPSYDTLELKEHVALIRAGAQQLSTLLANIADNKSIVRNSPVQLETIVAGFAARNAANSEAIDDYVKTTRILIDDGILPAATMIETGKLLEAQELTIDRIGPLAIEQNKKADTVSENLFKSSIDFRRTVDDLYDTTLDRLIYWSLITALVVGLSGIIFFRETMRPLKHAIDQMQKIAEGNLSEKPDVFGFGEPGKVTSALATMQIQLMVMLDEIQMVSAAVRRQVVKLNQAVISILNSTEDQYDQVIQIDEALESSGTDSQRLARSSVQAADLAQRLSEAPASATREELQELARITQETASLAHLDALAVAEIRRLSEKIMSLVAINREGTNDSWGIGQKLDETSAQLDGMLKKFE